jgi:hypothetical protein
VGGSVGRDDTKEARDKMQDARGILLVLLIYLIFVEDL